MSGRITIADFRIGWRRRARTVPEMMANTMRDLNPNRQRTESATNERGLGRVS